MFEHINTKQLEQELIALRREFHRYPESAWTEFRTTARIVEELEKLGLPVRYGASIHAKEKMYGLPTPEQLEACWQRATTESDREDVLSALRGGYTGCIATIEGIFPGPTIGIRVDIDCNDLTESVDPNHRPAAEGFSSLHPGCMHACGHDAHAAIGIGVAKLLCACRDKLHGKVILIFQPAEEGLRGAASLTAAGEVDSFNYLLGGHIGIKGLPVGTIYAGTHGFLASTKFDVSFHGIPAHAGISPEKGKNAMAAGATALLNMLAIPRHHDGASRINVGTFHSGTGRNVIPAEAELAIETRGATNAINVYMEEAAKRVCRTAADMYECECDIRFMGAAENAECDTALVTKAVQILSQTEGVQQVFPDVDFGGGEDITTMMRRVQEQGGLATEMLFPCPLKAPHHNSFFDIDEDVIIIAARAFAQIALSLDA